MDPRDHTAGLLRVTHNVSSLSLGDGTSFMTGHLVVSAAEAASFFSSSFLDSVQISCVSPGASARIIKVLDAIEPRAKGPGGGGIFPGFLGPAQPQGRGATHVLAGVAVVVAGYLPRAQEAIVDMSGSGAGLSPLGATHNVVVQFVPSPDAPWDEVESALRRGSLRLAARLAEAALESSPSEETYLDSITTPKTSGLPRFGIVTNLQTQGPAKDVFLYGTSLSGSMPIFLDPNELEDGAIVSGQFGHPALRNPTYLYQNHPVVNTLRTRDGRDLEFGGLIVCPEPEDMARKELISAVAARLCASLGFDAVIVTKEGGGNADADVAFKMDELERLGIDSVGILAEMSGQDGTGPPIVLQPTLATALVSTGNYDEKVHLDSVEVALGGDWVNFADAPASGELEVPIAAIVAALSPLGWGHLRAVEATR